jgi:hypothetical protein
MQESEEPSLFCQDGILPFLSVLEPIFVATMHHHKKSC